ncbi:MAG TPA: chromosomal replication initiator protein DnaA [Candidatus Kapabacteria bacterium]|nr:chromosomal replication initiator protein DnaA [Candidatus Kapabacteria bacterium]
MINKDTALVQDKQKIASKNSAEKLWVTCLNIVKDNINAQAFSTWFKPIQVIDFESQLLVLGVPSQFFYEWIEEHYGHLLIKAINKVFGENVSIQYQIVFANEYQEDNRRVVKLPGFRNTNLENQHSLPLPPLQINEPQFETFLNPKYTFENFLEGDSNNLARSAALAVSENPSKTRYNPLMIYGNSGLGKTHLAHAIGNNIIRNNKSAKVRYTNSERFTQDFIDAIRNNNVSEFTNFYRNVDILIIDDIQFLAGKEKTQDNFFHTFNYLSQSGKQIILTSDKSPSELSEIDARLISRFKSGLVADISSPDYEMRLAILLKKSYQEGIDLPYDVAEYLAKNIKNNVRELEGALIMLIAKVTLDRKKLNLDLAKEIVLGNTVAESKEEITINLIKKYVAEYFNIDIDLIVSKSRKQEIALARHMAIYLSKALTNNCLKVIGSHFGKRDHSTVLHSCKALENYLATDIKVNEAYETLLKQLKGTL